jgi:hypothetical protein
MSGCGCGGSAGCSGGCGGHTAPSAAIGTYSRPRFFAGQLLTEEDLQSLSDYVAAKDRLHNRYLFGEGVACGLEVRCHQGGEIVVGSGYALDCCGNDIVVPCDVVVDVNELIGQMPHEGICADPCPPPEEPQSGGAGAATDTGSTRPAATPAAPPSRDRDTRDDRASCRRYHLVIEYAEVDVEPLMPYSTGEAWESSQCETSRIREGYRFALRCEAPDGGRQNIWDRFEDCLGGLAEVRKQLNLLRRAAPVAERIQLGAPCSTEGEGEVPEGLDAQFAALEEALGSVTDEAGFRTWLDDLTSLAAVWIAAATDEAHVADAAAALGNFVTVVGAATDHADEHRDRLDDISRAVLDALSEQATSQRYTVVGDSETTGEPLEATYDDRLLGQCQPASDTLRRLVAASLRQVHEWLLCRAERPPATSCDLRTRLSTLDIDPASGSSIAYAASYLQNATRQFLLDCFCSAFNPPCPTCDDPAVALATVCVRDCGVVEVCNAVRHHLLTGPNVEYWLPPIEMLRSLLERLCCDASLIVRHERPCVQDPCRADIFGALGRGNALSGIGLDTDVIQRSVQHYAGQALRHMDAGRWRTIFAGDNGAPRAARSAVESEPTVTGTPAGRLEATEPAPVKAATAKASAKAAPAKASGKRSGRRSSERGR